MDAPPLRFDCKGTGAGAHFQRRDVQSDVKFVSQSVQLVMGKFSETMTAAEHRSGLGLLPVTLSTSPFKIQLGGTVSCFRLVVVPVHTSQTSDVDAMAVQLQHIGGSADRSKLATVMQITMSFTGSRKNGLLYHHEFNCTMRDWEFIYPADRQIWLRDVEELAEAVRHAKTFGHVSDVCDFELDSKVCISYVLSETRDRACREWTGGVCGTIVEGEHDARAPSSACVSEYVRIRHSKFRDILDRDAAHSFAIVLHVSILWPCIPCLKTSSVWKKVADRVFGTSDSHNVKLKCRDGDLHGDSSFLSCASPFFDGAIRYKERFQKLSVIDLSHFSVDVISAVTLCSLVEDQEPLTQLIPDKLSEVYIAATMLQASPVLDWLRVLLKLNLCEETFSSTLAFADQVNDVSILDSCVSFIGKSVGFKKRVFEDIQSIFVRRPELATAMLLEQQKQKKRITNCRNVRQRLG